MTNPHLLQRAELTEVPAENEIDPPSGIQSSRAAPGVRSLLVATLLYGGVSLLVWWNVWTAHPTTTTLCGCGDPSLFTWFLSWPAHAILHGQNPLYSTNLFYPGGVNLLSNTSELAIGIILAPVTWAFGPIATLNVALFLCPLASALGTFVLLRRWIKWLPGAFIGGLAYGFAPFLVLNLTGAWIMVSMAVVPPLVILCLDELLFRQRRRPVTVGIVLGLLIVFQFFVGTELLLIMAVCTSIGLAIIVVYTELRSPTRLRAHFRHAALGCVSGATTATILLAYPLWFAFAGPAHLPGTIWPNTQVQYQGLTLSNMLFSTPVQLFGVRGLYFQHRYGGYQGQIFSTQYFGILVFVVIGAGLIAFRRDRRMWFFGSMALASFLLSLGESKTVPLPWALLGSLSQFDNVIPERFLVITWLCVALLVAMIVDHTYWAVDGWRGARRRGASSPGVAGRIRSSRWTATAIAVGVAVVALVQPALYVAKAIPLATRPVVLPTWFQTVAPRLDHHQVLLVIPSGDLLESAATWQAVDGLNFSVVGGPGPGDLPSRAGPERPGSTAISTLMASSSIPQPDQAALDIRDALHEWGVTTIVIPDQSDLPRYEQIPSVTLTAALMTAATGRKPTHQADAWVWLNVDRAVSSPTPVTTDLAKCVAGLPSSGAAAVDSATNCAVAARSPGGE